MAGMSHMIDVFLAISCRCSQVVDQSRGARRGLAEHYREASFQVGFRSLSHDALGLTMYVGDNQ